MLKEISIYLPESDSFVRIAEGDGSNLSSEDEEEGYVDYVMIYEYEYEQGELVETDGGQMMLYNSFGEVFGDNKAKLIKHGCDFIELPCEPHIVIEEVGY